MNGTAVITVGITCYREGEWLRECWESVLAQDDDRWEAVLVMDGAAYEATRKVFGEIEHPRLRKFAFEENMGPYPVRNKAFELTRTPYHFYLDADDLVPRDAVGLALRGFEACPDAGVVLGDVERFGRYPSMTRFPAEVTRDVFDAMQGAGAYRKSVWEQLGGYAREWWDGAADADFHARVLEAGYRIPCVGKVMYRQRTHARSVCYLANRQMREWEYHEMMVRQHPWVAPDGPRLRSFLYVGYLSSVDAYVNAGRIREAKNLAKKALARGCAGSVSTPMGMLARVPVPVFLVVRSLWRVRRLSRQGLRALVGRRPQIPASQAGGETAGE